MNVIVGLDDTATSKTIIDFVCSLEMYKNTNFRLIHVENPIMVNEHPLIAYAPLLEPAEDVYMLQARDLVISSSKILHEKIGAHNNINADVLIGLPTTILLQQAKEWPADLIVVGSHGRSGIEQFLLGSVSREIVSKSPCSVMVVKIGKRLLPETKSTQTPQNVSRSAG